MNRPDETLRSRALEELGPLGDALARRALEHGEVFLDAVVVAWEGTSGTMHGHRVLLVLEPDLCARAHESHAATGALVSALSAALARQPGQSLAELRLEPGAPTIAKTPYR